MKERIRCLLLTFIIALVFCVNVSATEQTGAQLYYVTDEAGLLSENENMMLEKMAETVSQKYGIGVYIVTVEDYRDFHSEGVYKATYTIYHEYTMGEGPDRDGIMLLLSMDDRDWAMFCYGSRCEYAFNSYGQQKLEKVFLDNFGENDWYGGFEDYIKECSVYLEKAASGKPVRASLFFPILIVIGLSLLAAAVIVSVIWQKMENVLKKQPLTPMFPRDFSLQSKQIILPIRRPPAGRLSAALPAAGAATANPAEAVPAEAENSERSGYENNTQTRVRAIAGTGSVIVALRLYAEDANGA